MHQIIFTASIQPPESRRRPHDIRPAAPPEPCLRIAATAHPILSKRYCTAQRKHRPANLDAASAHANGLYHRRTLDAAQAAQRRPAGVQWARAPESGNFAVSAVNADRFSPCVTLAQLIDPAASAASMTSTARFGPGVAAHEHIHRRKAVFGPGVDAGCGIPSAAARR